MTHPQPKAAVFTKVDDVWLVAETPREVLAILEQDPEFAALTSANPEDARWHGRTVYIRPEEITAIAPPVDTVDVMVAFGDEED